MSEKLAKMTIDENSNSISIEGLRDENVIVDYSGDVDFTELVETLTDLIDENHSIKLESSQKFEEGKISIVLDTVQSIFQKYNDSITVVNDSGQAELDVEDNNDLPF